MPSRKYYDYWRSCPVDLDRDGCDLADWDKLFEEASFAKHRKGFPVFLPPRDLGPSDEYREANPYSTNKALEAGFNKSRIEATVAMVTEAIASVKGAPRILDLGCGQGHITCRIRQASPGSEISALDSSISAIEYASDHFPGIDFAVGDAHEAPYAGHYFDIVVCNNLLEHVPAPVILLNRIAEIIKPSGFLILSTPNRYRICNLLRAIKGEPVGFMSRNHITEYTAGQVIEQLNHAGFKVTRCFGSPVRETALKDRIYKTLFSRLISLAGSQRHLETTSFFMARQAAQEPED